MVTSKMARDDSNAQHSLSLPCVSGDSTTGDIALWVKRIMKGQEAEWSHWSPRWTASMKKKQRPETRSELRPYNPRCPDDSCYTNTLPDRTLLPFHVSRLKFFQIGEDRLALGDTLPPYSQPYDKMSPIYSLQRRDLSPWTFGSYCNLRWCFWPSCSSSERRIEFPPSTDLVKVNLLVSLKNLHLLINTKVCVHNKHLSYNKKY